MLAKGSAKEVCMRSNAHPPSRLVHRLGLAAGAMMLAFSGTGPALAQSPETAAESQLESLSLSGASLASPLGVLQVANLGARFGLELGALGALGYLGFQAGQGPVVKLGLGLGAPVIAAAAWATFGSPKAAIPLTGPAHALLEVGIFGSATLALAYSGHPDLARAFGIAVLVNSALLYLWNQ
jgi:hypothetical protein